MKKNVFACMMGDVVLYTVGIFRTHAFRIYPDGFITKANDQETLLALSYNK